MRSRRRSGGRVAKGRLIAKAGITAKLSRMGVHWGVVTKGQEEPSVATRDNF